MNKEFLLGFGKKIDRIEEGRCPFCGVVVNPSDFRDELSKKEWKISGLCQKCQDKVFA